MSLVLCPSCQRHVRESETACPFCAASLEGIVPRKPGPLLERSRAAVIFFSAAALAGCGKETKLAPTPDAGPLGPPTVELVQPYGVPVINVPPTDAGPPPPDPQPAVPAYGVPPVQKPQPQPKPPPKRQ